MEGEAGSGTRYEKNNQRQRDKISKITKKSVGGPRFESQARQLHFFNLYY